MRRQKTNSDLPEFLAKRAVDFVNKRVDITEEQDRRLRDIDERLKIPPSAIIRQALECFLPKLNNYGYTEEGIKHLWNDRRF